MVNKSLRLRRAHRAMWCEWRPNEWTPPQSPTTNPGTRRTKGGCAGLRDVCGLRHRIWGP